MPENHSLFDLLILSLSNAALIGLGLAPEPGSNSVRKDLNVARYNIELLEELEKKTKGNLSKEEANMLSSLLYDLRLKFVEARK